MKLEEILRQPKGKTLAYKRDLSSPASAQHRLAALAERGLIIVVGSGPRDPRRRWFAAGTGCRP